MVTCHRHIDTTQKGGCSRVGDRQIPIEEQLNIRVDGPLYDGMSDMTEQVPPVNARPADDAREIGQPVAAVLQARVRAKGGQLPLTLRILRAALIGAVLGSEPTAIRPSAFKVADSCSVPMHVKKFKKWWPVVAA